MSDSEPLVVLCCGTGGVGKTTSAAAIGVSWAMSGKRTCVLTIDPAKRLADAFGLESLDNDPNEVDLSALHVPSGGALFAMMLDRKQTFDESVVALSPDAETAEKLLQNRYYRAVSTRLTGSHEYMATEKLYRLLQSGRFDVIVVDTPPSQHALDFFMAPGRIQRLFDGPMMTRLLKPRQGLTGGSTRRLVRWLLSLVGKQVVDDIANFFSLMSQVSGGFAAHSGVVASHLNGPRTHVMLVTSAASSARAGALEFVRAMKENDRKIHGFVLNRFVHPTTTIDTATPAVSIDGWAEWGEAIQRYADERNAIAARHKQAGHQLSAAAGGVPVWTLPYLPSNADEIAGLARLASHLPPLMRA